MNFARYLSSILVCAACIQSVQARPFAPVEQKVKDRTKARVIWELDMAARGESQAQVKALLRKPLTLAAGVQIALLNNRDLQASFEEIGLSFADVREARTLSNPELDFTAKFPDRAPSGTKLEWGVAQNFLSLLMIPLRSRVAGEQLAAAQLRASDEVIKLVSEVKAAVYRAQAEDALIARLRLINETQGSSLEFMQKLHAAGNVTDLQLTLEQAAYSQARLERAKAEADGRSHREKLNRLFGLWGGDTEWKLAGELPDVPAAEPSVRGLESLAVSNRLDLAAARTQLESIVKALGMEKTFRFLGALDFGIAGERETDGTNLTGPSLRLELPLFNQGQARIARGESQLRMAQGKFEQLAIEIRSGVRELRDRLISKREVAAFYRDDLLPTRRRILALTLLNYNAMLTGAPELFAAKREEIEAERAWIEARRDYWITRSELEGAVGGDLEGGPRAAATSSHKNTKSHH